MRKFICILLALITSMSVSACGTQQEWIEEKEMIMTEREEEKILKEPQVEKVVPDENKVDIEVKENNYNIHVPQYDTSGEEYFIRVRLCTKGIYAQDNVGNLYYINPHTHEIELKASSVQEFSLSKDGQDIYVLYSDGYFKELEPSAVEVDIGKYMQDVLMMDHSAVYQADGTIYYNIYNTSEWVSLEIQCKKLVANATFVYLIDEDNVLWRLTRSTNKIRKIAENEIDCDGYDCDKYYRSIDIWYITQDHELYILEEDLFGNSQNILLDQGVIDIEAEIGYFIAQREDGTYITAYREFYDEAEIIPIAGVSADIMWSSYAILDKDSKLHFRLTEEAADMIIECPQS